MFEMSLTKEAHQDKGQNGLPMSLKAKGCTNCGSDKHTAMQCYIKERKGMKRSLMKRVGKRTAKWIEAKHEWIKNNPPSHQGYWKCYLGVSPNCLRYMDKDQLTIDHVESRTRSPEKLTDQTNLKPSCAPCNEFKGSRGLEEL